MADARWSRIPRQKFHFSVRILTRERAFAGFAVLLIVLGAQG